MAASGENTTCAAAAKWGELAVHLKDFTPRHPTPNIVKIIKGQYRNIGVAKSVHNELFLHSIKTSKKVLAESVKVKGDGKRAIASDPKLSLPISYQGWFELLSEDGKAIRALQTVQELVRVFPQSALVRENIKAFIPKENGELNLDKTRPVHAGEQITLHGDITIPITTSKGVVKKKLLRCFDANGNSVYFAFEQKGLFSPVAGQGNISGVHSVKGLLDKFRLPIMVRLVHGIIPSRLDKGSFSGVFRMISVYSDETAFVCPLKKDAKMVPISTREPIKMVPSQNLDFLKEMEDYKYYSQRCTKMVASYMNSIHVLVTPPDPSLMTGPVTGTATPRQTSSLERTVSTPAKAKPQLGEVDDFLFAEIDDIYQYVREGGAPPAPRTRPVSSPPNSYPVPDVSTAAVSPGATSQNFQASPEQATPRHQVDEDYWEEPIYEQIDKFQKKRRKSASGRAVPAGEINNLREVTKYQLLEDTKQKEQNKDSMSYIKMDSNLTTGITGIRITSGDNRGDESTVAPPIPPKRFEQGGSVSSGSPEGTPPPEPKPVTVQVTSSHPNSVHQSNSTLNASLNATHLIFNRARPATVSAGHSPYSSRVSVVSSTSAAIPIAPRPQYVAVARVGGDMFNNNDQDDRMSQRESARKKLQSMYL